jgi:hypothetical protein
MQAGCHLTVKLLSSFVRQGEPFSDLIAQNPRSLRWRGNWFLQTEAFIRYKKGRAFSGFALFPDRESLLNSQVTLAA